MKAGRVLFLSFLISVCTGSAAYWFAERQHKKMVVVDAVKLFDQFNLKKELEAKAKVKLETMGKQVDSFENKLKMAKATKDEEELKKLAYSYEYMKQQLESEYKQSNLDINDQVWKRLNPLVYDFGKNKGLHLIIGANGMGNVLYDDEYYDVTNDLIKYVNKRYEEGN